MRTTVDVPDQLFREIKAKAAREGISIKVLFERALEQELRAGSAERRRVEFPLLHRELDPQKVRVPALSNQQIGELFDAEDAERRNEIPGGR